MPRIVDHEQRRREIVHALWAVIHEQGIAQASLRAVAQRAGVSIGRIQHYFSGKDELVHEGCRLMVSSAAELFESRTETHDGDPSALLSELVVHPIPSDQARLLGTTVWYTYLARAPSDPEIAQIIVEAQRGAHQHAAELLARAEDAAHPDASHRERAVRLLAVGDGLAQRVVAGALDADTARRAALAAVHEATGGR